MSRFLKSLILSSFILLLFSCQGKQETNEKVERDKILKLHNQQRVNHFKKLLNESAEQLSDEFIVVDRGNVIKPTKEAYLAKRKNYFEAVEFEKWDDVNPPIIRFSDDYKMAYTIVEKEVIINYIGENGKRQRELTQFSWVAIYKKYGDEWKIDCIASTNKPSEISEIDE